MNLNRFRIHPAAGCYLDLLKRCLTREIFPDRSYSVDLRRDLLPYNQMLRQVGRDWPTEAVTMAGIDRLDSLDELLRDVLSTGVEGDFVECGVWRGGCSILMRAAIAAFNDEKRTVWLFDSFQGLPKPADPADCDLSPYNEYLAVSLEEVRNNFAHFCLLDDRVRFVPGWFKDTLPKAEVQMISVLRLDGDMYESTWVSLESLYPKVTSGGYVILDDYGAIPQCARAADEYRAQRGITSPLVAIDWTGVYWRK